MYLCTNIDLRKMKRLTLLLLLSSLMIACGSRTRNLRSEEMAAPAEAKNYGYSVVASYPHATNSYTQGLLYYEGELWEGTGQHGESRLLRYRLGEERPREVAALPRSEFGEGISILGGELFQVTWMNNTAHIYEVKNPAKQRTVRYPGEGWGLTTDGERLYLSDGSATLRRLNPATFEREGSVTVTLNGEPLDMLNELEWIEGRIWANIYLTDYIAIIHPETGVVEGLIDCRGLLPEGERTPHTDVLNGIAYDNVSKRIFLTGKNWSRLYEITIHEL